MGRRRTPRDDPFAALLPRLAGLSDSPLAAVGDRLRRDLENLQTTLGAGLLSPREALAAARHYELIVKSLPHSFGERFLFDTAMIRALVNQWSRPSCQLPTLIVPRYDTEWGHVSLPMLSLDPNNVYVIHLLYIQGEDDLANVDLLSYSWMCHELAHNLLFRHDARLVAEFRPKLMQRGDALRISALSDQGSVRDRARELREEMVQVWSPSGDQRNWAHELAADLIALWTCGPAFLAAFKEAAEDPARDPHRIDQCHPTYYARAGALIEGARTLGWTAEGSALHSLRDTWRGPDWKGQARNRSLALADRQLLIACVRTAIDLCKALELPRCGRPEMARLGEQLYRGVTPDFGTELILAAWLVREQRGDELYQEWERATVSELQRCIML